LIARIFGISYEFDHGIGLFLTWNILHRINSHVLWFDHQLPLGQDWFMILGKCCQLLNPSICNEFDDFQIPSMIVSYSISFPHFQPTLCSDSTWCPSL
jgi:hypothetical protein